MSFDKLTIVLSSSNIILLMNSQLIFIYLLLSRNYFLCSTTLTFSVRPTWLIRKVGQAENISAYHRTQTKKEQDVFHEQNKAFLLFFVDILLL